MIRFGVKHLVVMVTFKVRGKGMYCVNEGVLTSVEIQMYVTLFNVAVRTYFNRKPL